MPMCMRDHDMPIRLIAADGLMAARPVWTGYLELSLA